MPDINFYYPFSCHCNCLWGILRHSEFIMIIMWRKAQEGFLRRALEFNFVSCQELSEALKSETCFLCAAFESVVCSALSLFMISLPYLWQSLTLRALVKFTRLSVSQWGTVNSQALAQLAFKPRPWGKHEKKKENDSERIWPIWINLTDFIFDKYKKILRTSTSCALHVAICCPMLPIFRIFLKCWFYIRVRWDLVRSSEI